ncbi:Ribosome biogenesis protein NSA2 [Zea mays]|uniref:Ribosome biogenesis protein NSA2 homolog n=2 Tax=Zea mays TaxID=4577 RepID=A0A3L6DX66_MAIZE|nr:Ribosome biogenesis protein NSA2 [Zea mays]
MSDEGGAGEPLSDRQKREIATCSPSDPCSNDVAWRPCADVRALLGNDAVYEAAAAEAFPEYNKARLVSIELPDRSGDIMGNKLSTLALMTECKEIGSMCDADINTELKAIVPVIIDIIISTYGEIDKNNYLDPRTAQVATIDHMKQTCTKLRPAEDEELPSAYIEEFRCALDVELSKYVSEAYPKGACAVYCTSGKDIEGPGADFSFAAVISAAKRSPQNFWYCLVDAHYFEEGNVQLDTNIDRKDSTRMQSPDDCAVSISGIIRHHESEYLSSLEESYLNLSDATFKHRLSTSAAARPGRHPPAQKAPAAQTTGALNPDILLRLPFLLSTQTPTFRVPPPCSVLIFPRARVLLQPQGDHIELHQKRHGKRLDHEERKRKREARELIGAKGKRFAKKRYAEKAQMKKTLKMHDESNKRQKVDDDVQEGALPPYLLDRDQTQRAKVLSNTIKQKRKEKAGKWDVPLPKVRPVAEEEMFKVLRTGKRKTKQWKRMVTKATFVGAGFTRKPPKYERFIRPTGLRFTKAHVTHPELKCTFNLDIISVKKNPNGPMYTSLGVMTRGTIIEVNVSELGLVTPAGKVVWGKYAQVTNNPENDGCINAVLLV